MMVNKKYLAVASVILILYWVILYVFAVSTDYTGGIVSFFGGEHVEIARSGRVVDYIISAVLFNIKTFAAVLVILNWRAIVNLAKKKIQVIRQS